MDCPLYLVKLSAPSSARVVGYRRRTTGQVVYGEATAAGLAAHFRNETWAQGAAHVTSPPLRPDAASSAALLNLLARFLSPHLFSSYPFRRLVPFRLIKTNFSVSA